MFGKAKVPAKKMSRLHEHNSPFFPELALRRRSNEHPMVMFAALAGICLGSMALIPTAGPALTSAERPTVKTAEFVETTGKGGRLAPRSEREIACYGQAWGHEDAECLMMIAREAGHKDARQIRMIASAEPDRHRPNIF
ncbi:hypothetical protein [Arvimicrobium flavum]|uniref:hypothetical protein n=1 Tax=Arvimicrobium flavum TaxID=3393320 RepID=UPI00237BB03B|nr:hypothetical protein [Mesorhizobium shangrilense]